MLLNIIAGLDFGCPLKILVLNLLNRVGFGRNRDLVVNKTFLKRGIFLLLLLFVCMLVWLLMVDVEESVKLFKHTFWNMLCLKMKNLLYDKLWKQKFLVPLELYCLVHQHFYFFDVVVIF